MSFDEVITKKISDVSVKDYFSVSDFSVITRSPQPRVEIRRLGDKLNLIASFGTDDSDLKNLVSFSYSRNMDETKSKFSLRIKDSSALSRNYFGITENKNVFDSIQMFDIVEIHKTAKEEPDFIGVIHSKQISATIGGDGKVRKEISISGNSIVSLYSDFNINLSVIGTYATSTDAANFTVKNNYFTVKTESGTTKLEPNKLKDVILDIWKSFSSYADKLSNVTNTKLLQIINSDELDMAIECEDIDCKFPLSTNLYTDGEMNFIQMLRAIFPNGAYEIFEHPRKLVIRERPFCKEKWKALTSYQVNINRLIEYDFNQNDNEVYSVFMADVEGLSAIETRLNYKKKSATTEGFIKVEQNLENIQTYGYRLCNVNFLGYAQNPKLTNDNEILSDLDKQLKEMYENNHKMLNGRIKMVDQFKGDTPTIGDKLVFKIKHNNSYQETEFYINSETHSWNFGSAMTVEYNVSRGAVYNSDGSFYKTPEYFSTAIENEIPYSQRT